VKIGVLAMQGAYIEHLNILNTLNVTAVKIRYADELDDIDGLIIPGGESTSIRMLLDDNNLFNPIKKKILSNLPVWGTCAGLILLANTIENQDKSHFQAMDMTVTRNAYGRQLGSFKIEKMIPEVSSEVIPLVFIRAPYIKSVGASVDILANHGGKIIAAKQNNILATSFHPELSNDTSFHNYFIDMVKESSN